MAKIVWIASYPKSGNTFIRTLVCNLVFGPQPSTAEIRKRVPDIHEGFTIDGLNPDDGRLVKTHFMYGPSHPYLTHSVAAIYMARHPLQVMASRLNFMRLSQTQDYHERSPEEQALFDKQYIASYLGAGGAPASIKQGMGTWNENVESWLSEDKPFPVFALKYEDLKRRTPKIAKKICTFLNLQRSDEEIAVAVEAAAFDRMKKTEEEEIAKDAEGFFAGGLFKEGHKQGLRFMNEGADDSYKSLLSADEIARAKAVFGPGMARLKYS